MARFGWCINVYRVVKPDLSLQKNSPEESRRGELPLIIHKLHAANMKIQLLLDMFAF